MIRRSHVAPLWFSCCVGCAEPAAVSGSSTPRSSQDRVPRGAPSTTANAGAPAAMHTDDSLHVHIELASGARSSEVELPCGERCLTVEAVAKGGYAPYSFRWNDGDASPRHQACSEAGEATSVVSVTVMDTAVTVDEFASEASHATATITLRAHDCMTDAGAPPTTVLVKECEPYRGKICNLGGGAQLPSDVTVDLLGTVRYFAAGAVLAAGRYRVSYVDGCNTYGIGANWTIHALEGLGDVGSCNVLDEHAGHVARAPGTTGIFADSQPGQSSAFLTYDECVTANCHLEPVIFEFAGGKLGVRRDGVSVGAVDDLGGEAVGGRSPTFRLDRMDTCP